MRDVTGGRITAAGEPHPLPAERTSLTVAER
jgi:hypothetical protein